MFNRLPNIHRHARGLRITPFLINVYDIFCDIIYAVLCPVSYRGTRILLLSLRSDIILSSTNA